MLTTLLTATSSLFLAMAAQAPAPTTSCLAGPTRVEYRADSSPGCCDGQLRCPQYLATTKIARGHLDPHT